MVRIDNYLQGHNRIRIAALVVSCLVASFAFYLGVAVYTLTTGPKAVGDYMQARFVAVCWMAVALVANVGIAWFFSHRGGSFLGRFFLSVVATMGGAILVFGLIIARVVLFRGLWAR